ncbi:unnamed protein product [Symbiodinium sp. CCMP2592]|nr:unnamed protein product [Symbiodinium sp. CCMP2592]
MLPDLPKIPVGTTWDEDTGKIELASPTVTMWSEESPDPGMTEAAEMETIKTETAEAPKSAPETAEAPESAPLQPVKQEQVKAKTKAIPKKAPAQLLAKNEAPDSQRDTTGRSRQEAKKTKVPLEEPAADGHDGPVYNGKRMRTARGYMQDYDIPNEQARRPN